MRPRKTPLSILACLPACFLFCFFGCDKLDSAVELGNVASVKFSEGSPAVSGQNVAYSGSVLSPSLDKFKFTMVFHVKADNSGNTGKAVFGSDALKPILGFHLNSKSSTPIQTTVPAFSVAAGAVENLDFPVEIPIALIDKATVRKIINGDPLPYFLTGTLKFDVLEGTALKGAGTSQVNLASGEIETRPSSSVTGLLTPLL
jgi:hypothetical protein